MTPGDRGPVGLLGGSFDPIHVGHVQLARDALQQLGLAQVLFVPAGLAWQKGPAVDGAHRARMIELAIGAEPRFALDRRELARPGPSYTVDTLCELRSQMGALRPLVLLIGADQLERLDTWDRWEQLMDLAHVGVAGRPGHGGRLRPELAAWRDRHLGSAAEAALQPSGLLVPFAMHPVECSSTQVRALLRDPSSRPDAAVTALLAPDVLAYITRHGLYS